MKITKFKHVGVSKDGLVKGGGAVETEGALRLGRGEGCGSKDCHCSEGFWLMIAMPRTPKGVVEGITVRFDSKAEMNSYLEAKE